MTTFVAVHDQLSVDLAWERLGGVVPNLTLLFLGDNVAAIPEDTVVCVNYEPDSPNLYDFAGFRVLVKHNLIKTKYAMFLQYDHRPEPRDDLGLLALESMLAEDPGMVAFVPAGYDQTNWMLQVPNFSENFHQATCACGSDSDWNHLIQNVWPTTQGHAWRSSYFYTFMNWAEPGLEAIKDEQYAGHLAERLLTVYCAQTHPPQYLTGLFVHESKDVHGTGALMSGNVDLFNERNAVFGK